jgi:hypothetical protein
MADPRVNRIAKTQWLLDMFNEVTKSIYNLDMEVTVDECVVPYKGQYCFITQFMPDKSIRFGIKVWLLASSKSRFIWKMEVYFGKSTWCGEHGLGYHVVDRMMDGLEHRGHCLVVDNLFASVNLFYHLMVRRIWATDTIRWTNKNLPSGLYRNSNPQIRGSMLIRTHVHRQMGVVSWQDKKLMTLLSTTVRAECEGPAVGSSRCSWTTISAVVPHVQAVCRVYEGRGCNRPLALKLFMSAEMLQVVDEIIPPCC